MSLTIAQRAELIQRQTGCTRDEALRRARIADGAARDAADRAARVQAANAGTVQRTQQSMSASHHVQHDMLTTHVIHQTHIVRSEDRPDHTDCSKSTVARDTGSDYSAPDSGGSCGGGDF